MKTFAIGDIHGNYKALIQCINRSKFNYKKDRLIILGDVCDGWPFVKDCFDEILKIKNFIYILGNHDEWTLEWFNSKAKRFDWEVPETIWTSQGGANTLKSYTIGNNEHGKSIWEMPDSHLQILKNAKLYHIEDNKIFVHGGIPEKYKLEETKKDFFTWDRSMLERAYGVHHYNPKFKIGEWEKIFIGHTSTQNYKDTEPLFACNVINLDTGAGWSGKLTIMDINSYEYWQSDLAKELYPNTKGRK